MLALRLLLAGLTSAATFVSIPQSKWQLQPFLRGPRRSVVGQVVGGPAALPPHLVHRLVFCVETQLLQALLHRPSNVRHEAQDRNQCLEY